MLAHNKTQHGFTIVELLIAMAVGAIVAIGVYSFFGSSMKEYFRLQEESLAFADVAANSQRIASVLRGLPILRLLQTQALVCIHIFHHTTNMYHL